MRPLRRVEESISLQLGLALLVVVLLLAVVGAGTWLVTADAVQTDVRTKLVSQSEAEADGLNDWFASNKLFVRLVSDDGVFATGDDDAVRRYLHRNAASDDVDVLGLHYIDMRENRVLVSTVEDAAGEDLSDRPWPPRLRFQGFGDVYVSEPYTSPRNRTVVAFVSPTETINGALVSVVDVTEIGESFRSPIPGTVTHVIDSRGIVIFSENPEERLQPYLTDQQAIPEALVRAVDGESGFQETSLKERELGYDVVTAYAPVEGTDWVVIMQAPTSSAYAVLDRIVVGIVTFVGLALAGVLVVALTFGRTTTRDISELTETAEAYASGDYDAEPSLDRDDELGTLAAQMGAMRDALESRIDALESARGDAERRKLQLQRLLANLPVVLFVVDADGELVDVQGHTPEGTFALSDAVGARVEERFGRYPELVDACTRALSGAASSVTVDVEGGIFHVQVQPIQEDGEVEQAIAVASDVTREHNREQQIQVLNRVLRHDLRNRLSVIVNYARHVAETVDDPDLDDALDRIVTQSEELVETSEKARNVQRALDSAGESVDIVELAADCLDAFEETHPGVAVERSLPATAPAKATVHLGMALEELLTNAVEHTQDGSPTVRVSVANTLSHVDLVVEDDGPGMPASEKRAIVEGEEKPLAHSSGLGLWFVYWLVTAAGGQFAFEESDLGGLAVRLSFPRAEG
ncbi:ATP-binding protein [Haloarchaeobius amylolyticus]|uniref:ATP-binding protein n=1 Tax=Haloarchaeobius amylolyticus TaxID=1198296 RepID=UPI00227033E5|nr:ATP-binding protein [Haloarchaeobius amylolyticus]